MTNTITDPCDSKVMCAIAKYYIYLEIIMLCIMQERAYWEMHCDKL